MDSCKFANITNLGAGKSLNFAQNRWFFRQPDCQSTSALQCPQDSSAFIGGGIEQRFLEKPLVQWTP